MSNPSGTMTPETPGGVTFELESSLLRFYLDVVRRRIWIIASVFLVVLVIGLVRAYRAVPVYQAVAKVMVKTQVPQAVFQQASEDYSGWDPDYYKTQVELIASRAILARILERPEVRAFLDSPDAATDLDSGFSEVRDALRAMLGVVPEHVPEPWERLRGLVRAEHMDDTQFLLIRAESRSARTALLLANATAQAFVGYYMDRKQSASDDAFGFLSEEVKQAEQSLNQAGEALQKFRESSGNIGLDQSADNQPVLARLKTLNNEFTAVQLQRIDLEAKRMVVENLLQGSISNQNNFVQTIIAIPFIREDAAVMDNLGRLANVDKQLASLENVYGAQHPQLLAAKAERIRVSNELEQVLRATVQSLGNRLETLRGQEAEIRTQLESQRIEAVALARDAFEFGRLQAEVDRQRQIYDTLMARMMEIDVTSGFMRTNVEIVEEALLPKAPIRPNRSRMATMSAFFGLVLGLALGFVLEHLDDTVKTPEDLREKLGVSLLGFVPLMKGVPAEGASMGVLTATEPLSSIAEAYRSIRTSLFYSIPAGHAKVLVFTSCGPGEGKTTTAGNLAVAMALSGKRTLLIDADLHRPAVHHLFNLERETGLTSILVGDATLEQSVCQVELPTGPLPNLHVVTGGPDSPNPGELIGSSIMAALIQEAGSRYDWVIVDTPPVFFVSDTCVLGAMADGVVIVVRVGVNNRSHLRRLRQHLEQMNIRIVGAILNRVVVSRMGRYFSDYYYHGYSRYAKDYHKSYYPSAQKSTRRVKSPVPAGTALEPVEFFPPAPVDPSPAMPEAVTVPPPVEQPVADDAETLPVNTSGDAGPAATLPVPADEAVNLPVEPVKEPDVMPERPLVEPVPVPTVEVVDRKDAEPVVPEVPSGDAVRSKTLFTVQDTPSVQPVETPVESAPIPVVEKKTVKDDTLRPAFVMESVAGKVSDLKERLSGMESSYQQFEKRLQLLAKKRQSKPESP